jgi:hypothetical protein
MEMQQAGIWSRFRPGSYDGGPEPGSSGSQEESTDGTIEVDGPFTQAHHPAPHRIADLTQRGALRVADDEGRWISIGSRQHHDDLDSRFAPTVAHSVYVLDAINRRKVASGQRHADSTHQTSPRLD